MIDWIKKTFTPYNIVRIPIMAVVLILFYYGFYWFHELYEPYISNLFFRWVAMAVTMFPIMGISTFIIGSIFKKIFPKEFEKS